MNLEESGFGSDRFVRPGKNWFIFLSCVCGVPFGVATESVRLLSVTQFSTCSPVALCSPTGCFALTPVTSKTFTLYTAIGTHLTGNAWFVVVLPTCSELLLTALSTALFWLCLGCRTLFRFLSINLSCHPHMYRVSIAISLIFLSFPLISFYLISSEIEILSCNVGVKGH